MTTHRSLHPSFGSGQPALRFEPIITLADGDVRAHEAIIGTGPRVGFGITTGGAFDYILRKVAEQIRRGAEGSAVSFNVTLDQLLDEQLPERIIAAAAQTGIEPHSFLLEIDATLAEADPTGSRRAIDRLHEDAWSITLDRIEAAESPRRLLALLPVDMVKVDQDAIRDASRDRLEELTAAAAACRSLGIATVAAGVRTLPGLAAAIAHGYDLAQGPLFGEQVPAPRVSGEASGPTV